MTPWQEPFDLLQAQEEKLETAVAALERHLSRVEKSAQPMIAKVMAIIATSAFTLACYTGARIISNSERLSRIEESRFTDADAADLERQFRAYFPSKDWLAREMQGVRKSLDDLEARMRAVEQKIR